MHRMKSVCTGPQMRSALGLRLGAAPIELLYPSLSSTVRIFFPVFRLTRGWHKCTLVN
jgi:hypothetical protein